jgi:N-glycosylase/DNA lyase
MRTLLESIEALRKNPEVRTLVDARMAEFRGPCKDLFSELCFCILTANFSAEGGIRIQQELCDGFLSLTEDELRRNLKECGYRFPNTRARYIAEAREHAGSLKDLGNASDAREWLVRNVKGLGYKEASHFLRNIGYGDVAIVDFHVVDLLVRHGLIEKPRAMTKKRYMEVESLLRGIAEKVNLSLAELDLYLWYLETGKVLK